MESIRKNNSQTEWFGLQCSIMLCIIPFLLLMVSYDTMTMGDDFFGYQKMIDGRSIKAPDFFVHENREFMAFVLTIKDLSGLSSTETLIALRFIFVTGQAIAIFSIVNSVLSDMRFTVVATVSALLPHVVFVMNLHLFKESFGLTILLLFFAVSMKSNKTYAHFLILAALAPVVILSYPIISLLACPAIALFVLNRAMRDSRAAQQLSFVSFLLFNFGLFFYLFMFDVRRPLAKFFGVELYDWAIIKHSSYYERFFIKTPNSILDGILFLVLMLFIVFGVLAGLIAHIRREEFPNTKCLVISSFGVLFLPFGWVLLIFTMPLALFALFPVKQRKIFREKDLLHSFFLVFAVFLFLAFPLTYFIFKLLPLAPVAIMFATLDKLKELEEKNQVWPILLVLAWELLINAFLFFLFAFI